MTTRPRQLTPMTTARPLLSPDRASSTSPLMSAASRRRRASSGRSAWPRTRARWGRARRRSPPTARWPATSIAIPTARRPNCARRSAVITGSTRTRIVCGSGSDELIGLLLRAYAGSGDEVLYSRHGFLMYPIGAKSVGATPVAAPERDLTADVDALPGAGHRAHPHRLHRQPEQPDRDLPAGRRDARGCMPDLPRACAAGDRRGLCRVRQPQRLRARHRAGRPRRERRDAAHLLEDLRAGRAAARLGLLPAGDRRRAEPHPRSVQCDGAGAGGRDRGGRGYRARCAARRRP